MPVTEETTGTIVSGPVGLDAGYVSGIGNRLQGLLAQNGFFDKAIAEQQNLKGRLNWLYDKFQADETGRIRQDVSDRSAEARGDLRGRGVSAGLANANTQGAADRNRSLSTGLLLDSLLPRRINSLTGVANSISDSLGAETGTVSGLLGSLFGGAGSASMRPTRVETIRPWNISGVVGLPNSPGLGQGLAFGGNNGLLSPYL